MRTGAGEQLLEQLRTSLDCTWTTLTTGFDRWLVTGFDSRDGDVLLLGECELRGMLHHLRMQALVWLSTQPFPVLSAWLPELHMALH